MPLPPSLSPGPLFSLLRNPRLVLSHPTRLPVPALASALPTPLMPSLRPARPSSARPHSLATRPGRSPLAPHDTSLPSHPIPVSSTCTARPCFSTTDTPSPAPSPWFHGSRRLPARDARRRPSFVAPSEAPIQFMTTPPSTLPRWSPPLPLTCAPPRDRSASVRARGRRTGFGEQALRFKAGRVGASEFGGGRPRACTRASAEEGRRRGATAGKLGCVPTTAQSNGASLTRCSLLLLAPAAQPFSRRRTAVCCRMGRESSRSTGRRRCPTLCASRARRGQVGAALARSVADVSASRPASPPKMFRARPATRRVGRPEAGGGGGRCGEGGRRSEQVDRAFAGPRRRLFGPCW